MIFSPKHSRNILRLIKYQREFHSPLKELKWNVSHKLHQTAKLIFSRLLIYYHPFHRWQKGIKIACLNMEPVLERKFNNFWWNLRKFWGSVQPLASTVWGFESSHCWHWVKWPKMSDPCHLFGETSGLTVPNPFQMLNRLARRTEPNKLLFLVSMP